MASSPVHNNNENSPGARAAGGAGGAGPSAEGGGSRPAAPVKPRKPLGNLPPDTFQLVLEFLNGWDVARFAQVSRDFLAVAREEQVWKALCLAVWPWQGAGRVSRWAEGAGGWRALYTGVPHVRFDGLYVLEVSRWKYTTAFLDNPSRMVVSSYFRVLRFLPGGVCYYGLLTSDQNLDRLFALNAGSDKVFVGQYRATKSECCVRVDVGYMLAELTLAFESDYGEKFCRMSVSELVGRRPGQEPISFRIPGNSFFFEPMAGF